MAYVQQFQKDRQPKERIYIYIILLVREAQKLYIGMNDSHSLRTL